MGVQTNLLPRGKRGAGLLHLPQKNGIVRLESHPVLGSEVLGTGVENSWIAAWTRQLESVAPATPAAPTVKLVLLSELIDDALCEIDGVELAEERRARSLLPFGRGRPEEEEGPKDQDHLF